MLSSTATVRRAKIEYAGKSCKVDWKTPHLALFVRRLQALQHPRVGGDAVKEHKTGVDLLLVPTGGTVRDALRQEVQYALEIRYSNRALQGIRQVNYTGCCLLN